MSVPDFSLNWFTVPSDEEVSVEILGLEGGNVLKIRWIVICLLPTENKKKGFDSQHLSATFLREAVNYSSEWISEYGTIELTEECPCASYFLSYSIHMDPLELHVRWVRTISRCTGLLFPTMKNFEQRSCLALRPECAHGEQAVKRRHSGADLQHSLDDFFFTAPAQG